MELDEKKCPQCAETIKADALVCRYCGHSFVASQPGQPVPAAKKGIGKKGMGCLISLGVLVLVATCTAKLAQPGSRLASTPFGVDTQLQHIKNKVAADAVTQYNIAARGGSAMDRCAQAGMVAAAYLQAQDQTNYDTWKATEKADCRAAGVPR